DSTTYGQLIVGRSGGSYGVLDFGAKGSSYGWIQYRNRATTGMYPLVLNPLGGNVGIGTTTPNYELHMHDGTNNNTWIQLTQGNTGTAYDDGLIVGYNANGWAEVRNRENAALAFGTNDQEQMRIDNGGNVGIGTTAPSDWLDIRRNVSNHDEGLTLWNKSTAGYGTAIKFGSDRDPEGPYIQAKIQATNTGPQDGNLKFYTANTSQALEQRMVIKGNGSVGIGTTNPGTTLEVSGNMNFSHSATISASGGSDSLTLQAGNYLNLGTGSVDAVYIGRSDAAVPVYIRSNGTSMTVKDNKVGIYNSNPAGLLHVATNALVVSQNGNVGIGTTAPGAGGVWTGKLLSLKSSSGAARVYIDAPDNSNAGLGLVSNGSIKWYLGNNGHTAGNLFTIGKTTGIETVDPYLAIKYSDGKVGIGTTDPGGKLEITGADDAPAFILTDSGGGNGFRITSHSTQGSYAQIYDSNHVQTISLDGRTDSSSRHVYFNNGGNVGIGTTAPDLPLVIQVKDNEDQFSIRHNGIPETYYMNFSINEIDVARDFSPNVNFVFSTTDETTPGTDAAGFVFAPLGVEKMRITNTGNVGIGTTNPLRNLHVVGQGTFDNGSTGVAFQEDDTNTFAILGYDQSDSTYNDILIRGNSGGLTIKATGNVGINTAAPGALLEIDSESAATVNEVLRLRNPTAEAGGVKIRLGQYTTAYMASIETVGHPNSYEGASLWLRPQKSSGGSELGNGIFLDTYDKVGIGTTAPRTKTEIAGGQILAEADTAWYRKTFNKHVTTWADVVTFDPDGVDQYGYGFIEITASAYVNITGEKGVKFSRWYYSNTNGTVTVGQVGTDVDHGAPPDIQLIVESNVIKVQVQSNNTGNTSFTDVFVNAMLGTGFNDETSWAITE
ncbi:hypothetical protein ACFL57_02525, partial [Candidatus Margulisiibacteriota bacterium]